MGPESTGKSTLAQALAAHYQTLWVPEFARHYCLHLDRPYEAEDIIAISFGQAALEKQQARACPLHLPLICDTTVLVEKVWIEHAFGYCPTEIYDLLRAHRYDLTLLTDIDIAWEPDPLREHPHLRQHFRQEYMRQLYDLGQPFHLISGTLEQRLLAATALIDAAMTAGS